MKKQPTPKLQLEQALLQKLRDTPSHSSSKELVNGLIFDGLLSANFFQVHKLVSPADTVARAIRKLRSRVSIVQRYYRSRGMNQAISLWILEEYDDPKNYPVDSWAEDETYDQRVRC